MLLRSVMPKPLKIKMNWSKYLRNFQSFQQFQPKENYFVSFTARNVFNVLRYLAGKRINKKQIAMK